MKRFCWMGAILFLALTACHRPDSDPNLSNGDLTYCCLYLLGLSDADVSALMQKAYPTVCERDRKIRRIIGQGNDLVTVLTTI